MRTNLTLIFALTILSCVSCGQQNSIKHVDEGRIIDGKYINDEIGWTIEIPKNWEIRTKDKMTAGADKIKDSIEKTTDLKFDMNAFKYLISFQNDGSNIFQASTEPFKAKADQWENNIKLIHQTVYTTYTNEGIKIDTSSSYDIIDGLTFNVFKLKIYGINDNIMLYQDTYNRLINGYQFGVIMMYNNETDKQTMMDALKNSKFKK